MRCEMPRLSAKMKELLEKTMRDDIIDASVEIIIEDGVDGLTTDKLSSRINVSRGTLYNYFKSKDDIVKSVCERNFKGFLNEIDDIAQGEMAEDVKLLKIAEYMINDFSRQRRLHAALMEGPKPKRSKEFLENHKRVLNKIGAVISAGVASRVLRDTDPPLTAVMFFGALRELCFSHSSGVLDSNPREMLRTFDSLVIGSLRAR